MSRERNSSRRGGVLEGLLKHAAREYKEVEWQGNTSSDASRGPEVRAGTCGTFPARNTTSPRPSDEDQRSTDLTISFRNRGSPTLRSSSVGTGISRKRQRADISGRAATARKSSCDGSALASPSSGGHTEVAAVAGGPDQDNGSPSSELCQYEGCSKAARSGGRKFCRRHAEGRRCKEPGCTKVDVGGGSCRKHGGGRRCGADGCMKTDVGGGFCVSHGGGKRCQSEGCPKGAQAGGVFCKSHGGGRRCRIEGCMTSAQSGADVLCIKHGGGKRCMVAGCKKLVRKNNRCSKHAAEGPSNAPAPPPPVPASAAAKAAKTKATVAGTAVSLTTTGAPTAPPVAPVASAPSLTSRRRPLPPPRPELPGSWSFSAEQGPSEQRESVGSGGGYTGGGPLPSITSMAQELPAPKFSSGAGMQPNDFFGLRPPVATLGGAFAAGDSMRVSMVGGGVVPGGVASSSNGVALHGDESRLQSPLPGIDSIGSALLRFDPRGGRARNRHASVEQPPPPASQIAVASHLLSLGANLPRDAPAGSGGNAATKGGGMNRFIEDRLERHQPEVVVGSSPSQLLPVNLPQSPYLGDGGFSKGVADRSSSLQPMPPAQFLQEPSLLVSSLPPAVAASLRDSSGGRRPEGWPGDADTAVGRPAASYDGRGGFPSDRPDSLSSRLEGEPTLAAVLSRPPNHAAVQSSPAAAVVADNTTKTKASTSGGADPPPSPLGGEHPPASPPVAASARPAKEIHPTPAAPSQSARPSCCGGKSLAAGGRAAPPGSSSAPAVAPAAGKARSCSTSPPPEQTSSFISLSVSGMMCMENCGQTVQRALGKVPGVRSVTVHFPTRTAMVKVDQDGGVSPADLTSAVEAIGFSAECVATTTTEEPTLDENGVNAVWAIASALGLVDRGCAMSYGGHCSCGDDCKCVNCPIHVKKVSHAVDLVLQAVDLSSSTSPRKQVQPPRPPQQHQDVSA